MSKIVWKPGTMLYPLPAIMATCGDYNGDANIITIAWTGTINSDPAMTYISVRKERHSYKIIERTREFVLNLTTESLAFATDFCGVKSGANMDKFAETGLTRERAQIVSAPLIKESPINIECKVKDIIPLGTHDMFVAEVVSVSADEQYMDANGKFNFEDSKPICYSHGAYYSIGQEIGRFGFSVKKK